MKNILTRDLISELYEAPRAELFPLLGVNILEIVSLEGEVEDLSDGDDFQENICRDEIYKMLK